MSESMNEIMEKCDKFFDGLEELEELEGNPFLTEKQRYNYFYKNIVGMSEQSFVPFTIVEEIICSEIEMYDYYMRALMDVYCMYPVRGNFIELVQTVIDNGYADEDINDTHEYLNDNNYIQDGYVIVYRGEFEFENISNKDYRESCSYTLDREQAVFFATRWKLTGIKLTKSIVYTMKVPIKDIVAHIERENEVICIPINHGGSMEVIKTESFL